MKVLVAGECLCEEHRETPTPDSELVMPATCIDCDPSQTMFIGLETGELHDAAVVYERRDLDVGGYESAIRACMERFLHLDDAPRKAVREKARRDARWMNEVAAIYPNGTPITRPDGHTLRAHMFQRDAG